MQNLEGVVGLLIVEGKSTGGIMMQRCVDEQQAEKLMADIDAVATKEIEWSIVVEEETAIDVITGHAK